MNLLNGLVQNIQKNIKNGLTLFFGNKPFHDYVTNYIVHTHSAQLLGFKQNVKKKIPHTHTPER